MAIQPPPGMPMFTDDWLARYRQGGLNATAGRYTYGCPEIQHRPSDVHQMKLEIGHFSSFARNCIINLGSFGRHPIDYISSYPLGMVFGPVRRNSYSRYEIEGGAQGSVIIGSDVWIGEGAIINSGVSIGHGAVIGTRAIVTRSVEPYTIVAGMPAKPLRRRFDDQICERLLQLSWWNWSDEKIKASIDTFYIQDVSAAIDALSLVPDD